MPPKKLKKPPKNAFYFYMVERKKELEMQGVRFPGGMKDVASAVAGEWAQLGRDEKFPYEEESKKAKEEGKGDMSNKYTVTGESYAQMQRRLVEEKQAAEDMENYITELGMDEGSLDRYFILIKTIHCVEQILEKNNRVYWPLELSVCAFSLREGLKSIHWTLVDTVRTPVGYASAAKETSEETGLPEPGSKMMTEEFRDYFKIMKNTKGFIEYWTKKGYRKGPVVFAMEQEVDHARGCLQWMVERLEVSEDIHRDYDLFVENLKIFKLPKLILRLAENANRINPAYQNVLTTYKLEHNAAAIVNKGCYDYRDEITCHFHRREDASLKMYTCCRNVVLRRMYLMFEEFLPAYGLDKGERHDINSLGKAAAARAKSVVAKAVAASHPEPPKSSHAPSSSETSTAGNSWSRRKPDDDVEDMYERRSSNPTGSSGQSRRQPNDVDMEDDHRSSRPTGSSRWSRRKPDDEEMEDDHRSSRPTSSSSWSRRKAGDEEVDEKSSRPAASSSWSRRPKDDTNKEDDYRSSRPTASSSSSSYNSKNVKKEKDDVSSDNSSKDRRNYKRRHEHESDGSTSDDSRRHRSKSRNHSSSSRDRNRDADDYSSSVAPPKPSYSSFAVEPEGFVPWGRQREAPAASFGEDDFPALGVLPTPSRGRGAGRGLIKQEENDDYALGNGKYDY